MPWPPCMAGRPLFNIEPTSIEIRRHGHGADPETPLQRLTSGILLQLHVLRLLTINCE